VTGATQLDPGRLLTSKEAAERLRISPQALYYARRRGEAPPSFRSGRQRLYPERDLNAWIEARIAAPGGQEAA